MESATLGGREGDAIKALSRLWWLWLVFGIAWIVVSVVILQFDQASVTTVGIIVGLMFLGAACQLFTLAWLGDASDGYSGSSVCSS